MANARVQLSKLINRDGAQCHYCFTPLTRHKATRDHVVPRSLGGINGLNNYVLACGDCNSARGTNLEWCKCSFCEPLIINFKNSVRYVDSVFAQILFYNKPRIKRRTRGWRVYILGDQFTFDTFGQAVAFATTHDFVKEA